MVERRAGRAMTCAIIPKLAGQVFTLVGKRPKQGSTGVSDRSG